MKLQPLKDVVTDATKHNRMCIAIVIGSFLVATTQGCGHRGPDEGVITGRITYKGAPLPMDPEPRVFFESAGAEGAGGVANLDGNGNFTLPNMRHGEYKVYFQPEYPFPPPPVLKQLDISEKYWSAETSGVTFKLDTSKAVFNYDITD